MITINHNTDNHFLCAFFSSPSQTGQSEYQWYDGAGYGNYSNTRPAYIGLVKERDENNNLISLRWLGWHNKPILLGHHNGHSYFFIRHLKTAAQHTTYANSLGAYLFNPNTTQEFNFVSEHLLNTIHWSVPYNIDDSNTSSSKYMDQAFIGVEYNTDGYSGYKLF